MVMMEWVGGWVDVVSWEGWRKRAELEKHRRGLAAVVALWWTPPQMLTAWPSLSPARLAGENARLAGLEERMMRAARSARLRAGHSSPRRGHSSPRRGQSPRRWAATRCRQAPTSERRHACILRATMMPRPQEGAPLPSRRTPGHRMHVSPGRGAQVCVEIQASEAPTASLLSRALQSPRAAHGVGRHRQPSPRKRDLPRRGDGQARPTTPQ